MLQSKISLQHNKNYLWIENKSDGSGCPAPDGKKSVLKQHVGFQTETLTSVKVRHLATFPENSLTLQDRSKFP